MKYACKILADIPVEHDEFGSHERLAKSIKEILTEEEGGKAIALIGSWGSGKSTVVRLLKRMVSEDNNQKLDLKVVDFDAWAHEGDPLRRSFLERAIVSMKEWLINYKYWEEEALEEIRRRRRVQKSTSTPSLEPWGAVLAMTVFLVPLGLALFGSWLGGRSDALLWPGIILCLAPILVVAAASLFNRKGKLLAGVFINQTIKTELSETIETPEPTSVEFEGYYTALFHDALRGHPERRLCMVVDNLDRMSQREAIKLIATLKPFLQAGGMHNDFAKQVFYLVPFDEGSLATLWEGDQGTDEEPQDFGFARSFLDKIFQMRLYVPPQLISDQQAFLRTQLKKAFGGITDDDAYAIPRIFDVLTPKTKAPTPRQIISFVNHLVGEYRQWGDEIPLPHQAVYVILRVYRDCSEIQMLEGALKDMAAISDYILLDRLDDDLAALFLNITPEKAHEFRLEPEVEGALTSANAEYFRESESKKGLYEAIESIVHKRRQDWQEKEPRLLVNAAMSLKGSVFDRPGRRLKSSIVNITDWSFLDADSAKKVLIIHDVQSKETLKKILIKVGRSDAKKAASKLPQFTEGVLVMVDGYVRLSPNDRPEFFKIATDPDIYIQMLSVPTIDKYGEAGKWLRYDGAEGEIIDSFVSMVKKNSLDEKLSLAFKRFIGIINQDVKLDELIEATFNVIKAGGKLPAEFSTALGVIVLSLRSKNSSLESSFRSKLSEIVDSGWLHHHLHVATSIDDPPNLRARSIWMLVLALEPVRSWKRAAPNGQNGYNYMNNSARKDIDGNPDLSQTLFELVIDFGFIPEALKIVASEAKPYSDVLFPVLHEVLGWSEAYSILGDELIVENFDTLKKIAGDYTDALIASAANGSIISNIEQRRFQSVDASLSDLLLQTAPGHPSFKNWLVDGMSSVSADYWNEAILSSEDLSLMKLATRLGESLNKKLGTHLYDALRSIVSEASKGALDMMAIPKAHFQSALSWLDKIHSDTLKRNTRDHLLRTVSASVVNTFLDVFKPLLSDNEIMEEEADDFVRSFFPKVLSGEVDASRFTDLHASCPGMWVKARNQSREVFLESLKTTIANAKDDENRHQELEDLEQLLSSTRKKA